MDTDSLPPLLRLPSHLRERIYTACDILGSSIVPGHFAKSKFINLNNLGCGRGGNGGYSASGEGFEFLTTRALLLTCRTISSEVTSRVYADNHFFVHKDLGPLRRLRSLSIRSLTSLTVHMTVTMCGLRGVCDRRLKPGVLRWTSISYVDKRYLPESEADIHHVSLNKACLATLKAY